MTPKEKREQIENGENWIVEFWRVRGYEVVKTAMGISFSLHRKNPRHDSLGLNLTYLEMFRDEVIKKAVDDLTHWLNTENIDFVEAIDRLKTQINRVVIPSELLGENDQQEDEMMANENEIKEQYLKERMFRKAKGFAINKSLGFTEDYEEIYFEGETLEESIAGNYRKTEYWIYEPYDEQVFEDIDEALDYAEDMSGVSFEEYKKAKNVQ